MKRPLALTGAIVGFMLASASFGSPAADGPAPLAQNAKVYIVQMAGDPLAGYEGGISGMAATKPVKGKSLDVASPAARAYTAHLEQSHAEVVHSVGGRMVHDYHVVFNGFAAVLTPGQVEALKARGDVMNVWEDQLLKPDTNSTPDFLELARPGGPWRKGFVGEDIVIGIIDTGIEPDHPSLADERTPRKGDRGRKIPYDEPPASFTGTGCDFGNTAFNPDDAPFDCNNKLLKAASFSETFRIVEPVFADGEFLSARDSDGHGTHTATTAGGNFGVRARIDGENFGKVSGMAPRARIAAYKVCWEAPDPNDSGCFSSDSMAAIDQAVADGVDVINFSIGGLSANFNGADDIAFLFAQEAGVFVAVSGGNEGPGEATIGTPSGVPWVTATAASEDDENFGTGLDVNSPASIAGIKEGLEGAGPVTIADAGTINADVVPGVPLDGCAPLTNGSAIDGNIALIIRGTCGFIDKYTNAQNAGAQAIVVYNDGTAPDRFDPIVMGGLEGPTVTIPGLMIGFNDGDEINTTAGSQTVTGRVSPDIIVPREDRITGFSSRGPNLGAPDIIKPDVTMPGVGIIAGETLFPNVNAGGGQFFTFLSGTSMSSPHTAGIFALLKQAHPDWTAAMAKSAVMTTARQNLRQDFEDAPATPFDIGAGFVVPTEARRPGLVYDAGLLDYIAFMCGAAEDGTQPPVFAPGACGVAETLGFPFDASDLNLPSIGIAELVGSQTITRTVTSVAENRGRKRYRAIVEAPPGIDVQVSPSRIRLRGGETATYQVTFSTTGETVFDEWAFGSLTWKHGRTKVYSPIAIRPVRIAAPDELMGSGTDGTVDFDVTFGYTGDYQVNVDGLVDGMVQTGAVADGDANQHNFTVPPGTHLARFSIFDEDVGDGSGSDDLDLQVFFFDGSGFVFVGSSGTISSQEEVNLVNPAPGFYATLVIEFATAGDPTPYSIYNFNLTGTDAGNTTVTTPPAVAGTTGTVSVDWAALAPNTRYLGILNHSDGTATIDQTEISIDTH